MILIDANLPLYAYDRGSTRHVAARSWFEAVLSGSEPIRFAVVTLLAYVRIATNPAVYERPLDSATAVGHVRSWLERPNVEIATPSDRHWAILADLASAGQARGPLVMDAHLAALAIEHGATLMSTDRSLARFPGLRMRDPLGG
ncbi:MAG TPA: TA system VapC family ribonuclease toxin [Candidatus Limnocylindrales bacterium]|nr:TA system VapC family ribonuclease toxin [Candidatus Limnocylindrales bacterium]